MNGINEYQISSAAEEKCKKLARFVQKCTSCNVLVRWGNPCNW